MHRAPLIIVALLALTLVPNVSMAQSTGTGSGCTSGGTGPCVGSGCSGSFDGCTVLFNCNVALSGGANCILQAIVDGFGAIIFAVFAGVGAIGYVLTSGFGSLVVAPFFGIFQSMFNGVGGGIGGLFSGFFTGGTGAMTQAWAVFDSELGFFGPIAPAVAAVMAVAVIGIVFWSVMMALRDAWRGENEDVRDVKRDVE